MNDKELKQKVNDTMYALMKKTGIIAPVDVLMGVGVLSKIDYERWRRGEIDYLERVCKINLRKLSNINKEVRALATKNNLKPSWTFYNQWNKVDKNGQGKGKKKSTSPQKSIKLRFSKSGDEAIERQYATHYISHQTLEEIKVSQKSSSPPPTNSPA